MYFQEIGTLLSDSIAKKQPYIFHVINAECILHNATILRISDLCEDIVLVLIMITKDDISGRISIPLKYTNDNLNAKHLGDEFNVRFDGKCIHHGTRYETSFTDFRLNKDLVNKESLNEVVAKVGEIIKKMVKN